jgi:choline-phosphate cytidylyltransferase
MPHRRDSSAAPPSATSDGDEQSLSDLDYDVVSSASCGSLDSSLEMSRDMHGPPPEPPAAPAALARFAPATLGTADVQAHVTRALGASADAVQNLARRRPVRVYVDGAFDVFTAGFAPLLWS